MISVDVVEVGTSQHIGLFFYSFEIEDLSTVDGFVGLEGSEADPLILIPGMMDILFHECDGHFGKGIGVGRYACDLLESIFWRESLCFWIGANLLAPSLF